MSHVNSAGRVGALLGLTDPAAGSGDLANGGSTVTSSSVPDHVSSLPHRGLMIYHCNHRAAVEDQQLRAR